jgi:hypothetical protein
MGLLQKIIPAQNAAPIALNAKLLLKIVGMLAFLLPVFMLVGVAIVPGVCMRESISGFYFTPVTGDIFVGSLCFIGLFLFTYRGWDGDRTDNLLASFAGACSIAIAITPTLGVECTHELARMRGYIPTGAGANPDHYMLFGKVGQWLTSQNVHLALAGVFFAVIGYMCIYRFTKTSPDPAHVMTAQKRKRNRLYRICGYMIWACIAGVGLSTKVDLPIGDYQTFKFEFVALWAFGIAWVVKGELWSLMCDKP